MTAEDARLSVLESQRIDMARDIKDLKDDLKEFKVDTTEGFKEVNQKIDDLSLKIAYWAGAIAVVVIIAQLVVGKLLEHL